MVKPLNLNNISNNPILFEGPPSNQESPIAPHFGGKDFTNDLLEDFDQLNYDQHPYTERPPQPRKVTNPQYPDNQYTVRKQKLQEIRANSRRAVLFDKSLQKSKALCEMSAASRLTPQQ